ncbi:MAG: Dna2/Cas4 domain-containing protein [Deltaproteobacteria bacterium]|nr:Dna2/Cas4 domain-containing protein [Deltaproteobacteria bacterium]
MCLEEMLSCQIPDGALFYGKTRRRLGVSFDSTLRTLTDQAAARLHALLKSRQTPLAQYEKKCEKCSLMGLCLPKATDPRWRASGRSATSGSPKETRDGQASQRQQEDREPQGPLSARPRGVRPQSERPARCRSAPGARGRWRGRRARGGVGMASRSERPRLHQRRRRRGRAGRLAQGPELACRARARDPGAADRRRERRTRGRHQRRLHHLQRRARDLEPPL